jgi:hypothetical protein
MKKHIDLQNLLPNFASEVCGTWIDPIEKIIAIYHRNFNSAGEMQSGILQVSAASGQPDLRNNTFACSR